MSNDLLRIPEILITLWLRHRRSCHCDIGVSEICAPQAPARSIHPFYFLFGSTFRPLGEGRRLVHTPNGPLEQDQTLLCANHLSSTLSSSLPLDSTIYDYGRSRRCVLRVVEELSESFG